MANLRSNLMELISISLSNHKIYDYEFWCHVFDSFVLRQIGE